MFPIQSCPLKFRQILKESTPDRPQCENSPEDKSLTWGEGVSLEGESGVDSPRQACVTTRKKSNKEYVLKHLLQMREVKAWELKKLDEEIAKIRALEDADASCASSSSTQTPRTASTHDFLFTPGRPHTESDDEHDGIVRVGDVEVNLFGDDE